MSLIDKVLEQIVEDVTVNQDLTAIEELLTFLDKKYLIGYLSEENL